MIKQGENINYIGRISKWDELLAKEIIVEDLSPFEIFLSLQKLDREVCRLQVKKYQGYFAATIVGYASQKLHGEFLLEAAIKVDGQLIISDCLSPIVIHPSVLGAAVCGEMVEDEELPQTASSSAISEGVYKYTLELDAVGAELELNQEPQSLEKIVFNMGYLLKGEPLKFEELTQSQKEELSAVEMIDLSLDSSEEFSIKPNVEYIFGQREALSISFDQQTTGVCSIFSLQFESGEEPTLLTLPEQVKFPTPVVIKANCSYEVNILNNKALIVEWEN